MPAVLVPITLKKKTRKSRQSPKTLPKNSLPLFLRNLLLTCLILFIASCSGSGRTRKPYSRGKRVRSSSLDRGSFQHGRFLQKGIASYYGDGFHGKKTANGEIFNKNDLTAAHRTLPFNTKVKVTNLSNGKSVTVRINDRGPYAKGRIIDLSEEAGRRIGLDVTGTAKVKLKCGR